MRFGISFFIFHFSFFILIGGCAAPSAVTTRLADLTLQVSIQPDPPQAGNNTLKIKITDRNQKAVAGASMAVSWLMPAMPSMGMPEMRGSSTVVFKGGIYEAPIELSMGGSWILRLEIKGVGYAEYNLVTGAQGLTLRETSAVGPQEHAPVPQTESGLKLTLEKQQLVGVKTEVVRRRTLKKLIRTVGTVAHDLELYIAQSEYAQALAAEEKAKESTDQEVIKNAEDLAEAAHLKLQHLGLSPDLIEKIKDGDPSLIVGKEKGLVWIYGKIYENEIPLVKMGMKVEITSKNLPGQKFLGSIAALDPYLDEATRSLKVRAAVFNREDLLKPNMYVTVLIESPRGMKLAVPEEAVMDTGERQIVYVEKGRGVFAGRRVVIGQRSEGWAEVVAGLKEGERVVSSGTFLIDSESKLKSTGGEHQH